MTEESAAIETLFETFYDSRGLAYEDTEFDGRSDYQAFADAGIPTGGLFTGAEGDKTAGAGGPVRRAAKAWPSTRATTRRATTSATSTSTSLDENADAIAYATLTLAQQGHRGGN